jgi:hypothetical protein
MISKKLSASEVFEAENWREELSAPEPTVNKNGLSSIVVKAMEEYSTVAKHCHGRKFVHLPWNMAWWVSPPWANLPRWKNLRQSDPLPERYHVENCEKFSNCGELLTYAARFAGWLKTLAWFYGSVRVIEATQGPGVGSPYTTVNLYRLFERWPSPHRLERQIWKARARANQILKPYGLSVSWSALGQAMLRHSVVGKIALWAAEETLKVYLSYYDSRFQYYQKRELGQGRFFYLQLARGLVGMKDYPEAVQRWAVSKCFDGEFESLRGTLVVASRLRLDVTDGVKMYLDSVEVIHGVEVVAGFALTRSVFGDIGRMYLLRQVHTGRTYHTHWGASPKELVREALSAWKRQREFEKENAGLICFLQGDRGYSPLVYRESSYQAGNCQSGTEAWLEREGWSGMKFIPGQWLIPHLGDSRVRGVANALLKSF